MTPVPVGSEAVIVVERCPLPHLRPDELSRLAAVAKRTNLSCWRHGISKGRFRRLHHGSGPGAGEDMHLFRRRQGTRSQHHRRGHLFGEVALLDGQPRTGDAVAIEDTALLTLERNRLVPFLTANPQIQGRLIAALCQRVRQTSEHLEDALLRDASSRVARGLLRLAGAFGKPEVDGIRLDIRLSQQQFGNLIGISRESINKYLGDWSRAGHLSIKGGFITIRNCDALDRIADLAI